MFDNQVTFAIGEFDFNTSNSLPTFYLIGNITY